MNAFLDFLESPAAALLGFARSAVLQSTILIVVLWIAETVLRRRLRPAVRHALWLLVPIKLLLPPSLALPTGIGYWLPLAIPASGVSSKAPTTLDQPRPLTPSSSEPWPQGQFLEARANDTALPTVPPDTVLPPLRRPNRAGLLLAAWTLGSLVWLVILMRRTRALARIIQRSSPAAEPLQRQAEEARHQLGLHRPVRLHLVGDVHSPAVCGLMRPVILLPQVLSERLSEPQLRAVLLHEMAHARRGDLWVNTMQALLAVVWWWHPLLWLANARLRAAREEVVDDTVARELGTDRDAYPEALLQVARTVVLRPATSLGLVGVLESRSGLRRRIERLLSHTTPPKPRLGMLAFLAVLGIGLAVLPMAGGAVGRSTGATPLPAWKPWSEEAVADARKSGRPVLVHFTADWCLTGKQNERHALLAPAVQKRLAHLGVTTLRADGTRPDPRIDAALERHGRAGLPLTLLYPPTRTAPPLVLPEVLTPERVLASLDNAIPDRSSLPVPSSESPPQDPAAEAPGGSSLDALRQRRERLRALHEALWKHGPPTTPEYRSVQREWERLQARLAAEGDAEAAADLRAAIENAGLYYQALALRLGSESEPAKAQRLRVDLLARIQAEAEMKDALRLIQASRSAGSSIPPGTDTPTSGRSLPTPEPLTRDTASSSWTGDAVDTAVRLPNDPQRVSRTLRFDPPKLIADLERRAGTELGDDPKAWLVSFAAALGEAGYRVRQPNAYFAKLHRGLAMLVGPSNEVPAAERWLATAAPVQLRIQVDVHAFLLPSETRQSRELGRVLGLPPLEDTGVISGTLAGDSWRRFVDEAEKHPELLPIAKTQSILANGQGTEVGVSGSSALPRRDQPAGLRLLAQPEILPDGMSIRLRYEASVTQMIDLDGDRPREAKSEPTSDSGAVYSVRARGYVVRHMTNECVLRDGQATLLLPAQELESAHYKPNFARELRRPLVCLRVTVATPTPVPQLP